MRHTPIGRRALIRGAGGAAIALPFLEAMLPRRAWSAGPPPKRFMLMFTGSAIGQDSTNDFVPTTIGPNYDLKRAVAPLGAINTGNTSFGAYDVRSDVTLV